MIQTMRLVFAIIITPSIASGWVYGGCSRAPRLPGLLICSSKRGWDQRCSSSSRTKQEAEPIHRQQWTTRRRSQQSPFQLHLSTRSDENRPTTSASNPRIKGSTKKSTQDMLRFIEWPSGSTVGDDVGHYELDEDLVEQLEKIVKAADGRKAQDLVVLTVGHVTTMTQALVLCSGNSRPQNQAIANSVQEEMKGALHDKEVVPEGNPNSGWMVLDYGSIMVHIMTPKSRLFYNVEGQWRSKGGQDFRPDLMEQWTKTTGISGMTSYDGDDDDGTVATSRPEDDPFWS